MNRFDNNSKNYKLFKRNWKLFLKRYDDLNCTYQFYERSQREWVTAEQLVNQGLQLADQDFRKAYWDYQRLLEVIDDPTPSKIKIFKQCLTEVNQKY
ncbi:transposase, partial [Lactobacillus murinus]|nr:transposase [Ligilactobacillus murinus]